MSRPYFDERDKYKEISEITTEEIRESFQFKKVVIIIALISSWALFIGVFSYRLYVHDISNLEIDSTEVEETCNCPDVVNIPDCYNSNSPVLGGLDFTQYFGFENDSYTGISGHANFSAIYNGYEFWFINSHNKEKFEKNPTKYLPQWGGFCSWGMSGEYCPKYPWAADCLGPSGNWGIWTKQQNRLFFFYVQSAKDLFMEDPDYYIGLGDARWSRWFNGTSEVYNTNCYFKDNDGFIDRAVNPTNSSDASMKMSLPKGAPTSDFLTSGLPAES